MNGEGFLANRVEHGQQPRAVSSGTTPLVPVASENADGGVKPDPVVGTAAPVRKPRPPRTHRRGDACIAPRCMSSAECKEHGCSVTCEGCGEDIGNFVHRCVNCELEAS